jgi:hypothetical protein
MDRCIGNAALHQGLVGQMEEPTTAASCLASHVSVYSEIL